MKQLIEALLAVYATGELARVDELTTEQYVQQGKYFPEGRNALKAEIALWRTVFSDLSLEVTEFLADGPRIAVHGQIEDDEARDHGFGCLQLLAVIGHGSLPLRCVERLDAVFRGRPPGFVVPVPVDGRGQSPAGVCAYPPFERDLEHRHHRARAGAVHGPFAVVRLLADGSREHR